MRSSIIIPQLFQSAPGETATAIVAVNMGPHSSARMHMVVVKVRQCLASHNKSLVLTGDSWYPLTGWFRLPPAAQRNVGWK